MEEVRRIIIALKVSCQIIRNSPEEEEIKIFKKV